MGQVTVMLIHAMAMGDVDDPIAPAEVMHTALWGVQGVGFREVGFRVQGDAGGSPACLRMCDLRGFN